MSDTEARIEITASSSRLAAGLRAAAAKFHAFNASVGRSAGKIGSKAAGSFIGNVGANIAGRGIDFVAEQGKSVVDFEEALTRLQINTGKSGAQMDTFRKQARALSSEMGISANDILAGTTAYVDLTGDAEGAAKAMSSFTRIATASGSSVADIATATAALKQSFKISPEEIEAVFSGFIQQGKAGAVTLKDFAGELSALAPKWAKFNEATTSEGIAQFGASFQVARQSFGSAAEAATGMEALMGALVQHSEKLAKFGHVNVFEKHKDGSRSLKTFEQILTSIEGSKLVKDPALMMKALGGRKEALDTLTVLMRSRQNLTATGNEYTDLIAKGRDAGAVERDRATYLQSSAGRIKATWETMKNTIAEAMTPERIKLFADALVKVAEMMAKIVGFVEKVATKAEEMKEAWLGKSKEKREDEIYKRAVGYQNQLVRKGMMGRNAMLSEAERLDQEAANLYHKKGGMSEQDEINFNVNRRLADELRRKADVWNVDTGKARTPEEIRASTKGRYAGASTEKFEKYDYQFVEPIVNAIMKGFAGMGANATPVEVKVDSNVVAKANAKATDPRRRM